MRLFDYGCKNRLPTPGAFTTAYFDSNGVQIYFEEHGKGEPVVLVHGFASRADRNWGETNWYTTLAPHYRVVALDCRGHGKSGKPHDPAAYSGETMGEDVIRLLDHLGIKRTLIIGYSMGARIVTGLLLHHPERLRAAVLGGIGAVSESAPSFNRQPIVDALLAETPSNPDAQGQDFRQFAESVGNDLKALAACLSSNRDDFTGERIAAAKISLPVIGPTLSSDRSMQATPSSLLKPTPLTRSLQLSAPPPGQLPPVAPTTRQ